MSKVKFPFKLKKFPPDAKFNIEGELYHISDKAVENGDVVLDRKDETWGRCTALNGEYMTVKHEQVAEVGIHISRVFVLEKDQPNQ